MTIYYTIYFLLAFGALVQLRWDKAGNWKKYYCLFSFVLVCGMLALRHPSMGVDLVYGSPYGYLGYFKTIDECEWQNLWGLWRNTLHHYEIGYMLLCKLLGCIGNGEQILIVACAVLSVAPVYYIIYKYSDDCFLSNIILLGLPVFLINYSGLRQGLAIGLTVLSYRFIREKKPLYFGLVVFAAVLFHESAWLFLLAYPAYHLKMTKTMRYISVALFPVVYVLRVPLFKILSQLLKKNAPVEQNSAITLFLVFCAIYVFAVIFSDKQNQAQNGLLNIFWFACFCQAFGGVYFTATRVGYYFMIYLTLLLPSNLRYIRDSFQIPEVVKSNLKIPRMITNKVLYRVGYIGILVCFGAFGLYSLYHTDWSMAYPYYFFWQEVSLS